MAGRKKKEKPLVLKEDKPKRRHSQATRDKISEKRRARTVQPRNISQSARRTSFYAELLNDYKNFGGKKLSPKKKEELKIALQWIENNREELGYISKEDLFDRKQVLEIYQKNGIITEYIAMYHDQYEEQVGSMLYSDERTPFNDRMSDDPYDMADQFDIDNFVSDHAELFAENHPQELELECKEFYTLEIADD